MVSLLVLLSQVFVQVLNEFVWIGRELVELPVIRLCKKDEKYLSRWISVGTQGRRFEWNCVLILVPTWPIIICYCIYRYNDFKCSNKYRYYGNKRWHCPFSVQQKYMNRREPESQKQRERESRRDYLWLSVSLAHSLAHSLSGSLWLSLILSGSLTGSLSLRICSQGPISVPNFPALLVRWGTLSWFAIIIIITTTIIIITTTIIIIIITIIIVIWHFTGSHVNWHEVAVGAFSSAFYSHSWARVRTQSVGEIPCSSS